MPTYSPPIVFYLFQRLKAGNDAKQEDLRQRVTYAEFLKK